jgi:hypothetical protein
MISAFHDSYWIVMVSASPVLECSG